MSTAIRTSRQRTRLLAAGAVGVLLVAVLAACGSSSESPESSASQSTSESTETSAPETEQSEVESSTEESAESSEETAETSEAPADGSDDLAVLEKPLDAYPVPTDPIGDISSLKGTTLYYIPITMQSPQFALTQKALTNAAEAAGMSVQACDGKGTPTDVASCITQATQAKAGVIVTDAVPYVIAANAFDAAQAAGIPVIISNQIPDPNHPASATLTYMPVSGPSMSVAIADWVTADSGGEAHVLINKSTDGPSPAAFVQAGLDQYAKICPDCVTTLNEVSSSNFSLIPSSVSAALLKDPSITYVDSQFGQYVQATQGGVQQAGRIDAVKLVTGAGELGELQALASDGPIYAVASQASAFQGWVDADASMRLMLGTPLPDYTIPIRLFTKDTVSSIALTADAQLSGEWFGPTTFTEDFKSLWGVA